MLFTGETFLLGSRDDLSINKNRSGAVVIIGRNSNNDLLRRRVIGCHACLCTILEVSIHLSGICMDVRISSRSYMKIEMSGRMLFTLHFPKRDGRENRQGLGNLG